MVPILALVSAVPQLGGDGPDLTRYALVCALLVGGIVALGVGMRRLLSGSLRARAAKRSLRVLDVLPLGGRKRLAVVTCYDRTFVLGLGDREIALVAELDHEEEPAVEAAPARGTSAAPTRAKALEFAELLRGVRASRGASREPERLGREGVLG